MKHGTSSCVKYHGSQNDQYNVMNFDFKTPFQICQYKNMSESHLSSERKHFIRSNGKLQITRR